MRVADSWDGRVADIFWETSTNRGGIHPKCDRSQRPSSTLLGLSPGRFPRYRWKVRSFILSICLLPAILAWGLGGGAVAAEPRPDWTRTLERLGGWLDPAGTHPPVVTCRLRLTEAKGFPAGFHDATVDVALQAPDRCRLGWGTNRSRVEFGRAGPRVWLWEAASGRVIVAPVGTSADGLRPSVGLPVPQAALRWLPSACNWTNFPDTRVAGEPCATTSVWPTTAARDWLGIDDFRVTVWLRLSDGLPQAMRWQSTAGNRSLTAWPTALGTELPAPSSRWQPPAPSAEKAVATGEAALRRRLAPPVAFLAQEFGAIPADADGR